MNWYKQSQLQTHPFCGQCAYCKKWKTLVPDSRKDNVNIHKSLDEMNQEERNQLEGCEDISHGMCYDCYVEVTKSLE